MRRARLLLALALAAFAAACQHPAQAPLDTNQSLWTQKKPASYRFTFRWSCFCPPDYTALVKITVAGDQITDIVDAQSGAAVPAARWKDYKTIDGLFGFLRDAVARNADEIKVTYDPQRGFPVDVSIDYIKQAADDEMAFSVRDVTPL